MKHIKLFLALTVCFWACMAHAQTDIDAVKSDPAYWSAEGQGVTIEEAEQDALGQIIRQIQVVVSSNTSMSDSSGQNTDGTEYSSYAQSTSTNVNAFNTLQNVEKRVLSPEPKAKVFMWVAKDEVKKMYEQRMQKVKDYVETGRKAEQRLQIDDALRNYYWALMLSMTTDPVYIEINGEKNNCQTFLPLKIKSVIANIKAKLEDCTYEANRYYARMRFTYCGNDVASLQLHFFDGQSFIGPLAVKDGIGELDLVSLPADGKLQLNYEYRFSEEAGHLDKELEAAFANIKAPLIENSLVEVPVNIDAKKNTMEAKKKYRDGVSAAMTDEIEEIATEPITHRKRLVLETVDDDSLVAILHKVEDAIRRGKAEDAYGCFTPDGYKLFATLMEETGKVSLIGKEQHYEFVRNANQVLARFCKIKIKFSDGRSFTEDLVFRFNATDKRIESIAFALTRKAEDDIFNAASQWTEVSRFTILQFMEDYQTAYALKRLDYLKQIFSDNAIIITGTMLKTATKAQVEGMPIYFDDDQVSYTRLSKQQFIDRLQQQFDSREYTHLTFEDNETKVINAPRLPKGTAFAIQINQIYNSPVYSDQGYLTLVLDASRELPIIHVRLWQPEKADLMTLDEFMSNFEF